LTLSWTG